MRKYLIIALLTIVLFVSGILSFLSYQESKKVENLFKDKEEISSLLPMVNNQFEINAKLDDICRSHRYTLDNPYVELNPYKISPLSAIIIFKTKNNEKVKVYINDEYFTVMEASKEHIIPIYGLFEDYENVIKLVTDTKEKIINLKTEKSNIEYPLEVIKDETKNTNNDLYFTVASYKTWLTGWDSKGRLRFYLTKDNRMDVEWLDNGHFIIGTTEGQFAENFIGFMEMDYLGKIYNYYTLKNGFSFESQVLKNGNIMSAGGSTPVYIKEQVIYEINPNTGEVVSDINIYDIFKKIDNNFLDKYLGQAAVRNGFYYNEATNEMLVSFRGINTIFCVDYSKKSLKWIFNNPDNELFQSSVWDKYRVTSEDGIYPWGQHSPVITKEGYIAIFNNGYDRYNGFEVGGNDLVSSYKNNYSRAEIYEIKDMKAKVVWSFDASKKLFSHQYGSINFTEQDNKLINFGYVLKDKYRQDKKATLSASELSPDNIYSYIVEVDNQDKIIFEAKSEEGKYRVFKHSLYNKNTKNININVLNIVNTIDKEVIETLNYKKFNLAAAPDWIYDLNFTKNTFKTNYPFTETDEIKLYFVSKLGRVYILDYKNPDTTLINRIFNLELNAGTYAMYISINGDIYNTNKVVVQ